jgi:cyclic pyranopterin monophosphate synthase
MYKNDVLYGATFYKKMNLLTHLDANNNPSMVDVGEKKVTKRTARARAIVVLNNDILNYLDNGDIQTIIAGVMAAKKTGDLIPLCHPLGLENCQIDIFLNEKQEVVVDCTASLTAKTGVEMEALTGASIAALTIYDMCKAMSHDILIKEIKLMEKTGGKRDFKR